MGRYALFFERVDPGRSHVFTRKRTSSEKPMSVISERKGLTSGLLVGLFVGIVFDSIALGIVFGLLAGAAYDHKNKPTEGDPD